MDPKLLLARNGCALLFVEPFVLIRGQNGYFSSKNAPDLPLEALYMRATLSMLPVTKNMPSGDHARSYISAPLLDLHIVLIFQCS